MSVMAEPALYSRVVRVLKVALPLTALLILSVLFIVAEQLDPEAAIPYADVDVEQILRDQGITNPSFGGVTDTGEKVSVTAERLKTERDDDGDAMAATVLTAALELASGRRVDIDAPAGRVDAATQTAELTGGVILVESSGFVVETDRLSLNWADATGETGPITANGPPGKLTAGRMSLVKSETGNILVFDGGVRLLFYPDPSLKDDNK